MVVLRTPHARLVALLIFVFASTTTHAGPNSSQASVGPAGPNTFAVSPPAVTSDATTTPQTQSATPAATSDATSSTPTTSEVVTHSAAAPSDTHVSTTPAVTTSSPSNTPTSSPTPETKRSTSASPSMMTGLVSKSGVSTNPYGQITSFVYVTPTGSITSPSATPTNVSTNDTSLNQLITAGIALGAVVIAAAIGLWIFRKWKLGPSKRFAEKLQSSTDYNPYGRSRQESDTVFLRELQDV